MKVTMSQILDLQAEIAGITTKDFKIVGLLNEKLSMKTKYWLQKLFKKVTAEKEEYAEAEKSLFINLGAVEEDGLLIVKSVLENGTPNPAIKELDEQKIKLLSEEVDLGEFKFDINDFDIESESNYYTFMSVAFE